MPDPVTPSLEDVVRDATATGTIGSAAIFLVASAPSTLHLAAAAGIEGRALDGLVAAVANPEHPVARAISDRGPTFDVRPVNPGGPRLRSHLPLVAALDDGPTVVGVLALAHDEPLSDAERQRVVELARQAASAARP
jgi:hypothetical protein